MMCLLRHFSPPPKKKLVRRVFYYQNISDKNNDGMKKKYLTFKKNVAFCKCFAELGNSAKSLRIISKEKTMSEIRKIAIMAAARIVAKVGMYYGGK